MEKSFDYEEKHIVEPFSVELRVKVRIQKCLRKPWSKEKKEGNTFKDRKNKIETVKENLKELSEWI